MRKYFLFIGRLGETFEFFAEAVETTGLYVLVEGIRVSDGSSMKSVALKLLLIDLDIEYQSWSDENIEYTSFYLSKRDNLFCESDFVFEAERNESLAFEVMFSYGKWN